jgi:translation elongation factor P/translation initiation factor 5A
MTIYKMDDQYAIFDQERYTLILLRKRRVSSSAAFWSAPP